MSDNAASGPEPSVIEGLPAGASMPTWSLKLLAARRRWILSK